MPKMELELILINRHLDRIAYGDENYERLCWDPNLISLILLIIIC